MLDPALLHPGRLDRKVEFGLEEKTVTEKDFLDAVNKVIKGYQKFSATPKTVYCLQLIIVLC